MNKKKWIKDIINNNHIVLFIKGTKKNPQCGFSYNVINIMKKLNIKNIIYINILKNENMKEAIKNYSNWPTFPQLYINKKFIGGSDIVTEMYNNGKLKKII